MSDVPRILRGLRAAGLTDAGLQRAVNEDRLYVDADRGVFMVIDGVGGHAAGGKAADIALTMARGRLARETGPTADRVREAIAIANNEIHRLAATRPEWDGMGCVMTVAVVDGLRVTVGHVGDTRLYKIRGAALEKITPDHSPVGEREDAREISEHDAMRHPRRHEVYRDVGSDPHAPDDPEFVDVLETTFEPDAALLLCSDGLTDSVDSGSIRRIVARWAGHPDTIVQALVDAANAAGGKDNITVVYVEGEAFASADARSALPPRPAAHPRPLPASARPDVGSTRATAPARHRAALVALLLVLAGLAGGAVAYHPALLSSLPHQWALTTVASGAPGTITVTAPASISAALANAAVGSQVLVEPGEYREQLTLRDGVRVISRVPGAAVLRLPVNAADAPAVVADGVRGAELAGMAIVGDAATPLGVGVLARDATVSLVDVRITGALRAAIELTGTTRATLVGSAIVDNPGPALIIDAAASPRIIRNEFARNGLSERAGGALTIHRNAVPVFEGNVFVGVSADAFAPLGDAMRQSVARANWFLPAPGPAPRSAGPPVARPSQDGR